MLKYFAFNNEYVIDQMADLLKVTSKLCEERLEQIKNRCISFQHIAERPQKYEV